MKKNLSALALFAMAFTANGMMRNRPHFCLDGEDIGGEDCTVINSPGTSQDVFYAFDKDIEEYSALEASPTGFAGKIMFTQNFTMKTGKKFHVVNVHVDENSVQNEFMGEKGSGNFQNRARIFVQGNKADVVGFAAEIVRRKSCWLIPLNDGSIAQIGTKGHPAHVKAMFDSLTDEATDPRGWEFQITSTDTHPWRFSPSLDIPLEPAD